MHDRYCKIVKGRVIYLSSLIVLLNFLMVSIVAEPTAVVKTASGPVQGEILTTAVKAVKYAAFKGIRFAKPPVGYLRFQPPVPADPWTETLNATDDGNVCPQPNFDSTMVIGTEDCLFISVYTPVTNLHYTPKKLKAVMAWIYPGGFRDGSTSQFRPDYLLEKDIVFVAFNYRLGPLGFLGLGHPNASGNAGLKDQNLGLKWIQTNIKNFGGNPNNVTIFGESSGSVSVGYHVISDASAGLFHGAISMSGVPLNPWGFQTPETALSRAETLAARIGTHSKNKETLLNAFYKASAAQLINATSSIGLIFPPFTPTLEDKNITTDPFLCECSLTKYKTGNFSMVPQMLGYTDDESLYFITSESSLNELIQNAVDFGSKIGMRLPNSLVTVKTLIQGVSNVVGGISKTLLNAVVAETSDLLFIAQIDQTQKLLANKSKDNPIYYYHNSFYTDRNLHNLLFNTTLLGAAHADDVAYLFYFPKANYSTDPTDPMGRTIDRVTTMWTNFAKYGNPTPDWIDDDSLGITWPNSGSSGRALNIGTNLTVGPRPVNKNTETIEYLSWPFLPKINACNEN